MSFTSEVSFVREHDGATYTAYVPHDTLTVSVNQVCTHAWRLLDREHVSMPGPQQWAIVRIMIDMRNTTMRDLKSTKPMVRRVSFMRWMEMVDMHITRFSGGLRGDDLPDYPYVDDYKNGQAATVTAKRAIARAKTF